MPEHVAVQRIDGGIVDVGGEHPLAQIIEYDHTSHPSQPAKGLFMQFSPDLRAGAEDQRSAGRAVGRSPGAATVDMALMKNFQATERIRAQFRGEFFNSLNRANFGVPATAFGAAAFGSITTAAPARVIQLGLKIYF